MPFPTPILGIQQGPKIPVNHLQAAEPTPLGITLGEASVQGLKRKSDHIEDAESSTKCSRSRPSPEDDLGGNTGRTQDDKHTKDGISPTATLAGNNTLRSCAIDVDDGDREPHSRHKSRSSPQYVDNEAAESSVKAIETESKLLQLTEKESKYLLVSVAKVEAMLEREKWNLVAEAMRLGGTNTYPGTFLQEEYQRLAYGTSNNVKPSENETTYSLRGQSPVALVTQHLEAVPSTLTGSQTHDNQVEVLRATHFQSPADSHRGFGKLSNRGPLHYSPQQPPGNVRARMAEQEHSLHAQASSPIRSTRPNPSSIEPTFSTTPVSHTHPAIQKPLAYEKASSISTEHGVPRTEDSSIINEVGIKYTSSGAPIFVDSPATSTIDVDHTNYVSPYNSVESQAKLLDAPEAAVVEGLTTEVTQPVTRTLLPPMNDSRVNRRDDRSSNTGAATAAIIPSSKPTAFPSVDEAPSENHGGQSLGRQQGHASTRASVSVATPPTLGTAFVSVNQSPVGRQHTQSFDKQSSSTAIEAPASMATPPNSGTAFVSVNESSNGKSANEGSATMKWEEGDTRSRPRLANDKVSFLEREYQQDPKPTKEYKEELAKTLDTTYIKVTNWFSNRRSKATTQAKQLHASQQARHNSSTADPSPMESNRAFSTPVTEDTPDTERIQYPSHGIQNLLQIKSETLEATETLNATLEQRTPATPSGQPAPKESLVHALPFSSPDSHENRSSAMRAAWARRKAAGRNGRDGGAPKHSPTDRNSIIGGSPRIFAAQILAAAEEAQESASPTPAHQGSESLISPLPSQATHERFSAAITASSSPGDMAYSQLGKKRGPYKKRNVSGMPAAQVHSPSSQLRSPSLNGPSGPNNNLTQGHAPSESPDIPATQSATHPYACEKCGKAYQHFAGLKYHKEHHPNCEAEPFRTDKRTDPTERPSKSPEVPATHSATHPYACEKCGKAYQQFAGLKYHKDHHPNCEIEPFRTDKRTDPAERIESKKADGARIAGRQVWAAVNSAS